MKRILAILCLIASSQLFSAAGNAGEKKLIMFKKDDILKEIRKALNASAYGALSYDDLYLDVKKNTMTPEMYHIIIAADSPECPHAWLLDILSEATNRGWNKVYIDNIHVLFNESEECHHKQHPKLDEYKKKRENK